MPGPASFAGKYPSLGNSAPSQGFGFNPEIDPSTGNLRNQFSGGYNPFSGSLAAPPAPAAPNSNPLYDFYRTSTNGLDIRPEYGEWLKGQSDPAQQQWAKERYGVDLGSMLNQYGGADLGFSQPPPNVGMPTANLASLYASRPMPWKPAYGMAGYGQGLEMNPYNPAMTKPAMVGGFQLPNSWGGIGGGGPTGGLQGGGKGGGKGGGGRMPPAAAFSGAVPPPNGRATGWVD